MAFAAQERDRDLADGSRTALDRKGAFQAFRSAIGGPTWWERWLVFSADAEQGRARERLAGPRHPSRTAVSRHLRGG